ncbi:MAG: peroxiredoxin [Thermoanaerobaculia bacterium]
MTIQVGERLPDRQLQIMSEEGKQSVSIGELFRGKRVVLFAVPGAFTPTCSDTHLSGFLVRADEIRAKGVDLVACVAVNDVFVMDAWGRAHGVGDRILMLADGNGEFTRAVGLELDATGFGMGRRSQRYAAIVEDGVVQALHVESGPGVEVSGAESILGAL